MAYLQQKYNYKTLQNQSKSYCSHSSRDLVLWCHSVLFKLQVSNFIFCETCGNCCQTPLPLVNKLHSHRTNGNNRLQSLIVWWFLIPHLHNKSPIVTFVKRCRKAFIRVGALVALACALTFDQFKTYYSPNIGDYGFWWFLASGEWLPSSTHTERRPAVEVQYNAKSWQMSVAEPSTKVHTSAIEGASLGGNC